MTWTPTPEALEVTLGGETRTVRVQRVAQWGFGADALEAIDDEGRTLVAVARVSPKAKAWPAPLRFTKQPDGTYTPVLETTIRGRAAMLCGWADQTERRDMSRATAHYNARAFAEGVVPTREAS